MSGIIGEVERNNGIISAPPFAMLKMGSQQSVTAGSMTKVEFDEMYGGSYGSVSSDGWLVPENGMYKVDLQVQSHSTSNNVTDLYLHVKLDSTTKHGGYMVQIGGERHVTAQCTGMFRATAGQIIYGYAQTTGTSPMFYHDAGTTYGRDTCCMVITFLGK